MTPAIPCQRTSYTASSRSRPPGLHCGPSGPALVVSNDAGGALGDFQVTATPATVGKDEYGGVQATFQLVNSGSDPIKGARVGVVSPNKVGEIIGGTSSYPDVIPANRRIRVDVTVTTTGTPAACDVYPGPGF